MKTKVKRFSIFVSFVLLSIFMFGCNSAVKRVEDNTVKVSFGVSGQYARTALPDVNFADYKYTLTALKLGEESESVTLKKNVAYADLSKAESLSPANYRFTLFASQDGVNILSGVTEVDLSNGNKTVVFNMYPCAGASGNAEITIKLPSGGVVKTAKAFHSSDPVKKIEAVAESEVTTLDLVAGAGDVSAVYTVTGLSAGVSNFAIIYLYDAHGGLISTFAESLLVVGNLTCKSTITYTEDDFFRYAVTVTLNKNGERWGSSGKKLSLVSTADSNIKYSLKDTAGYFSASVASGTYNLFSDEVDTGIVVDSVDGASQLDYYTVTLTAGTGFTIETVSGGEVLYDGTVLLLKNEPYTFLAKLKQGYSAGSSFAIKTNDTVKTTNKGDLGKNFVVSDISGETVVSVDGAVPTVYNITYQLDSGSGFSWKSDYSKPTTFTVTDDIDLPTAVEYKRSGYLLDGWQVVGGEYDGNRIGYIHSDSIFCDLTIKPIWKKSVYVDTVNKVIYANGISLFIKQVSSATEVYLDLNGNGKVEVEDGDIQIAADNGLKNFNGYSLNAANYDPAVELASDFTFTMTGGTITSIKGLGANKNNRSVLNISGNSKIGSVEEDSSGNFTAVSGVELDSIYNEKVFINGEMTGDYQVVLISQYEYERLTPHYVAEIGDSKWASFKQFTCFKKQREGGYKKLGITMKEIKKGDSSSTMVLLSNPQPISLPTVPAAGEGSGEDENADCIIGDVNEGFSLGDNRISIECSVFSVSVEDGSFKVPRTTFTLNESASEHAIEDTLTYMAQPTPSTYDTSLALDKNYVYLCIMSEGNQITPEMASEFLSGVIFKRNPETPDRPVKVKINLETVPAADIREAGVVYFNGSFYKYSKATDYANSNGKIFWPTAYDAAKSQVFNGLHGYLMTVSSEVENFYIFNKVNPQVKGSEHYLSWMGGSRLNPTNGWDSSSSYAFSGSTLDAWYWQCGPEAGQMFYGAKKGPQNASDSKVAADVYVGQDGTVYRNAEKEALEAVGTDKVFTKIFTKWNNDYIKPIDGHTAMKTEPNDSGSTEDCAQFLSGSLGGQVSNGYWNDQTYQSTSSDYGCTGFITEFTPYKNAYNEELASCQSIMTAASY